MDLEVRQREKLGKANRLLRKRGVIPAEIYGHKEGNVHLEVDARNFLKIFKEAGENTVVNLLSGAEKWPALIYDVQRNSLTGEVIHIDFYRVKMTEKIKAHIPLEFIGESPVVREKRGVLNRAMDEIGVEALPSDLPHRIEIDISALDDFSKSIYAKDLRVAEGVKVLVDPETVVATVVPIKEEEAKPAEIDVSAVKVEGEEKRAEKETEVIEEKKKERKT